MPVTECALWAILEHTAHGDRRRLGAWESRGNRKLTAGRSHSQDVVFGDHDLGVSRRQLVIEISAKGWRIKNIGVAPLVREKDGKQFCSNDVFAVELGDVFRVSDTRLEFLAESSRPFLFIEIHAEGKFLCREMLRDKRLIIGAASRPVNDVVVTTEGVSKQHLAITPLEDGNFTIEDLRSRNGVFLKKMDADHSERVDQAEIQVGDIFSFGSAVGQIVKGVPVKRHGKVRSIGAIAAALLSTLLLLKWCSVEPQNGGTNNYGDRFTNIWAHARSSADLHIAIESLLDESGGNDFPERLNIEYILMALRLEKTISNASDRLNRSMDGFEQRLTRDPWNLERYDLSSVNDVEGVVRDVNKYSEFMSLVPRISERLRIPHDRIEQHFQSSVVENWNMVLGRRNRMESGVKACRGLLAEWQQRKWDPPPSDQDLKQWVQHASDTGVSNLQINTQEELSRYVDKRKEIERYWRDVDAWIKSWLDNKNLPMPTWPLERVPPRSNTPMGQLVNYAHESNYRNVAIIYTGIKNTVSVLEAAPLLLQLSQQVPERWRTDSETDILRRYNQEIAKIYNLINVLIHTIGDAESVVLNDAVRNAYSLHAPAIPRLRLDSPVVMMPRPDGLDSLIDNAGKLRAMTLTVAERFHQYGAVRKDDEPRAKADVKILMEYPFMQDVSSSRKETLVKWAYSPPRYPSQPNE